MLDRLKATGPIRFLAAVHGGYTACSGMYLAAAIAYYAFFSLLPLLLLAISALGFFLASSSFDSMAWAERLSGNLPGLAPLIGKNLSALIKARAQTGMAAVAGLLWTGLGVVQAASWALHRIFRTEEKPGALGQIGKKLVTLMVLGTLNLAALATTGILAGISIKGPLSPVLKLGGGMLGWFLDFVFFFWAYRLLSWNGSLPPHRLWPGALLASSGWELLKITAAWYGAHTLQNSIAVYGSLATAIAVLALLFAACNLFVYGAVLNQVVWRDNV